MSLIKIHEIRNQSAGELGERLKQLKKELYELRLAASIGNVEKPSQFKAKRREIAKILTVLKEKLENASSIQTP